MLAAELILLLLWGAALAPESALGRWLIHRPAAWLAALTPLKAAVGVISAVLVMAFLIAAPEMVGLFGLLDFSLLMDMAALSLLLGAGARLTAVRTEMQRIPRAVLRGVRTFGRRHGRRPRVRPVRPPSRNDDADGPAWAFA